MSNRLFGFWVLFLFVLSMLNVLKSLVLWRIMEVITFCLFDCILHQQLCILGPFRFANCKAERAITWSKRNNVCSFLSGRGNQEKRSAFPIYNWDEKLHQILSTFLYKYLRIPFLLAFTYIIKEKCLNFLKNTFIWCFQIN